MPDKQLTSIAQRTAWGVAVLFFFNPVNAASPQILPAQVKPVVAYHYVAEIAVPASRQGAVEANGIKWQCIGARCTTSGPWAKPGISSCQALAKMVGVIKSYGHNTQQLDAGELKQCNAGLVVTAPAKQATLQAPPTGTTPKQLVRGDAAESTSRPVPATLQPGMTPPKLTQGGLQPEPPTKPAPGLASGIVQGGPQPEPPTRQLPAVQSPALPGGGGSAAIPGGFGAAPPPGAAQDIREHAAALTSRPTIDSLGGYGGETCAARGFTVNGRNFGAEASGRRLMFMSPLRNTPVRAVDSFYSWNDGRITARLPEASYVQPGQRYVVAIVDAHNRPLSNTNREITICPAQFQISGDIRMSNCAAGAGNVYIGAYRGGMRVNRVRAQGVPGNDFAIRYELNLAARATDEIELRPELSGITCTGGDWLPGNGRVSLSYERPRATQHFEFRVGMETRRIPMSVISALVRDAFNGTQIRINNYDPATQRVRENDSFVRLSEALGGTERRFNIGPAVTGPRKYYINDINLQGITVRPQGSELKVSMTFETDGMELIGTCGQDGFDAGCIAGAPDVQASIAVDIFFTLDRYYSRATPITISYSRVRVEPRVDAQADGLCLALDFLCSAITDYRTLIRTIVQNSFMSVLDTQSVRDEVGRALLPVLRDLRIGTLNSVRVEGSNLVLTYLTDLSDADASM